MDDSKGDAISVGSLVGVVEAPADPARDECPKIGRKGKTLVEVGSDKDFEIEPVDVFHDDVVVALGEAEVIDLDDVFMDEIRDELRLADEEPDELRVFGVLFEDSLDGDRFLKIDRTDQDGLINRTHASIGDMTKNPIAAFASDFFRFHRHSLTQTEDESELAMTVAVSRRVR